MDQQTTISKEDAIFYLDMINSALSPNHVSKFYKRKPVSKLVKERESADYKRFMRIYLVNNHIYTERERAILDEFYGVHKPGENLVVIGKNHGISNERVRQIIAKTDRKISRVFYNCFFR